MNLFDWSNEAVRDELDIVSHQEAVEYRDKRILVGDTDVGKRDLRSALRN